MMARNFVSFVQCFIFNSRIPHGRWVHALSLSHLRLFAILWMVACQAPLSTGFPRQEYWSGSPFPPPEIFLIQGLNPHLLHLLHWQMDSLPLSHWGSPLMAYSRYSPNICQMSETLYNNAILNVKFNVFLPCFSC